MNDYEQAAERFDRASENINTAYAEAARIINEANAEYEAAQDNLRQYETKPGIPLPEFRVSTRISVIPERA